MLAACCHVGVEVLCKAPVTGVARDAESGQWRLRLEDGSEHASSCIASFATLSHRNWILLAVNHMNL